MAATAVNKRVAFSVATLKGKSQRRFECCATFGNYIFIGASSGFDVHVVRRSVAGNEWELSGIHSISQRNKRPVTQIGVAADIGILVTLSEGQLQLYRFFPTADPQYDSSVRLVSEEPLGTVNSVRDCSCFAMKLDHGVVWLAAVQKKRVAVCKWHEGSQTFAFANDLQLPPETPKHVLWSGASLLLCFTREYSLLDTETGKMKPVNGPGKSNVPVACNVHGKQENLIVIEDTVGVRITHHGKPAAKSGVQWVTPPKCVHYAHPYLLSIVDHSIEVHYPHPLRTASGQLAGTMCQSIPKRHVDALSSSSLVDYDAPRPDERVDGANAQPKQRDAIILLTNDGGIHLLQMNPIAQQVTKLFEQRLFDDALDLCNQCVTEVTEQQRTELMLQHGNFFFAERRFEDAISKFLATDADPRYVTSYFPGFMPNAVKQLWKPAIAIRDQAVLDPALSMTEAVTLLLGYLQPKRVPPPENHQYPLRDASILNRPNDRATQLAAAIDTAFVHTLVTLQQYADIADVLARPNYCVFETCEQMFKQDHDYVSLGLLYLSQPDLKQTESVLRQLREVGLNGRLDAEVEHRSSLVGTPVHALFRKLKDRDTIYTESYLSKDKVVRLVQSYAYDQRPEEREVMARQLMALTVSVYILKQLDGDDRSQASLVLDFSRWIIENYPPEYTTRIFIDARKPVAPQTVAEYLGSFPPQVASTYLGRVLGKNADTHTEPELHNRRIDVLLQILEANDATHEARGIVVHTLNDFLVSSKHYNAKVVIAKLTSSPQVALLTKERAHVYHRLGQHENAIRMFLNDKKPDEAEKYARDVAADAAKRGVSDKNSDAFRFLLLAYLDPGDGAPPRVEEALQIVRKNPQMDAVSALEVLPPHVRLYDLREFVIVSLRNKHAAARSAQVQQNLLKTSHRELQAVAAKQRSQYQKITSETQCGVCKKRIAQSIFARYPNGVVVHQACLTDKSVCPVTRHDFTRDVELAQ